MSLKGQVAFVAGSAGTVGSGIAKSLLEEGAIVWVASRDQSRLDAFKATVAEKLHDQIRYFIGSFSDEKECLRLKDEILKKDGKVNHVVSSVGGWWQKGTLSTVSVDEFKKVFEEGVLTHFLIFKTFSKILSETPNSTYTFITGGAGEAKFFFPEASLIPLMASSVFGVYTAAYSEFKDNKNLAVIQFRLSVGIEPKLDSEFDAKTSERAVGNDYIGKFVPKLIAKHKSEIYRIDDRTQGDKFFSELSA